MPACWTVCRHSNTVWCMAYGELWYFWVVVSQFFAFSICVYCIFSKRFLCWSWILDSNPIIWNYYGRKLAQCIWCICGMNTKRKWFIASEGKIWIKILLILLLLLLLFSTHTMWILRTIWRSEQWNECIRFLCINGHL